jgi:hypothetical protein
MDLAPAEQRAQARLSAFRDSADILECPETGEPLVAADGYWISRRRRYSIEDGVSRLFAPVDPTMSDLDVTETVKAFYEETPFPNYDDLDSRESLIAKSREGFFAAALDEQLPDGAIVLEVGCGTGQLTNFLGLSWKRRVFGGDICINSFAPKNLRERQTVGRAYTVGLFVADPALSKKPHKTIAAAMAIRNHARNSFGSSSNLGRNKAPGS